MLKPRTLLTVGLVFLALAADIPAHDLKVLAGHLVVPKPGARTTIYLCWGDTLAVEDLVDADALDRYDLLSPGGSSTPLSKADRSLQTNVVEMKEAGISQVVVSRKPAVLTFVEDAQGNRVMKRGPKSAVTEGKIDHALRSQQFAKALIRTGPAQGEAVKPVGLPLEIVPVQGPADWRAGGELRFQVLFQGKPLAEEQLLASHLGFRPVEAWCYATTTDRDGVATVRASQAGTWVLRVQLRKLSTGKTRDEYDYESYTATLALEIAP